MNPALPHNISLNNFRNSGVDRLPAWFKQEIPGKSIFEQLKILSQYRVHTVCQEAKCPNLSACFNKKQISFMILGTSCTRNCPFCNIGTVLNPKQNCPSFGDTLRLSQEPSLIREIVRDLGLNYVVITSVTRDDLVDGGAGVFAKTIGLIHALDPKIGVEVLIPDFQGKGSSLNTLLEAKPDLVAHNIETVPRLYRDLRPQANYALSLGLFSQIKAIKPDLITKSSLMLGLGEKEEEVVATMQDLRYTQCDILTLGQYLAPSPGHYPVKEFIPPEQFQRYHKIGLRLGFKAVLAGPLVRSSYRAGEIYQQVKCMT